MHRQHNPSEDDTVTRIAFEYPDSSTLFIDPAMSQIARSFTR